MNDYENHTVSLDPGDRLRINGRPLVVTASAPVEFVGPYPMGEGLIRCERSSVYSLSSAERLGWLTEPTA